MCRQNSITMNNHLEKQLQHSNLNLQFIQSEVYPLSESSLSWKESEKKWSVLEVIDHLNKVYELYFPNFQKAIEKAHAHSIGEPNEKVQRTFLGKLSIYTMKPKGNKRRFKVKTFDFFEPNFSSDALKELLPRFEKNKATFNDFIKQARMKNLQGIKVPTALGEKMKFYIPECFEFILAHEDRHIVQIQSILDKVSK